jgi:hypothetical protein
MALRGVALFLLPLLLATAWPGAGASAGGDALPEHLAADAGAPVVTSENILASERFWPYQVALLRPWKPAGRDAPLGPGLPGVLVRVETSTRARIDFGRDGVHEVPLGETDLVERANRVRRGELEKEAPNFVWAIGARLLDPSPPTLASLSLRSVAEHRAFLCVFADPGAEGFADLARALAPLRAREGLATLLFPQGEHPDSEVSRRLRALEWTVPFVHDHLAEGYMRSLLPPEARTPALLLQTGEGRLLLQRGWSAQVLAELVRALAEELAPAPVDASGDPAFGSREASRH